MQSKLVGSAHLVAGGQESLPALLALLEQEGIRTVGNPDVYVREYARMGADEARELRERAATRAIAGAYRVFVVVTPTMTTEAQNVLLKTFEEPPAGAMFFLVVPSPQVLLSTLRSRMQPLPLKSSRSEEVVGAGEFLAALPEKRLEMLKPLLEKDDDDKRDLRPILGFLTSLEIQIARQKGALDAARREGLEALYRARMYLNDKGALLKPLLEQVALLVPRMNV